MGKLVKPVFLAGISGIIRMTDLAQPHTLQTFTPKHSQNLAAFLHKTFLTRFKLFQIRSTKKVSMFPVGLITKLGVSTPLVRLGRLVGFYDGWMAGRKFPVDMAGFAVSVDFLLSRPKAAMPYRPGFEEDGFLKSLSPFEPREIELLAANCTKVMLSA